MSKQGFENDTLKFRETTTPTAESGVHRIYCKADDRLYHQDGAGVESTIRTSGAAGNHSGFDATSTTIMIDVIDHWSPLQGGTAGSHEGWVHTIRTGNGSISAFADAGGGQVTVTSSGHSVVDGDIVAIVGTTNYNGTYLASNVSAGTSFEITAAWVSDDATGTWRRASSCKADSGSGGKYLITWQTSATATANNQDFELGVYINGSLSTVAKGYREFNLNVPGGLGGIGFIDVTGNDNITFQVRNRDSTADLVMEYFNLTMIQI